MNIAPSDDISIPLEYTVEWPMGKEVVFKGENTEDTTRGWQHASSAFGVPPHLANGNKRNNSRSRRAHETQEG